MAKYSSELFDEIVSEMMKDKKTLMEMMVELDCDENSIYDSQTRIARKQQSQNLIETRMKLKEAKLA
jgi:cytochrome c-type biogenesis protein CcmH/NrfF